ncbi:MAG: Spy/CpxP family protein refolding chaperone [Bacteroidales bacterium]|nr:Spy/CpxP family protein refolding chaperone [Bacteroidales bacterium]
MKTLKLKTYLFLLVGMFFLFNLSVFAQQGSAMGQGQGKANCQGKCLMNIPDLTDEQTEQIENVRIENMKKTLPLKSQLEEKRAKYKTLMVAEKADMNEINKIIDEMGEIKTQKMKQRTSHKQEIRKILTDDQRVYFDTKTFYSKGKRMGKKGHGGELGMGKMNK